MDNSGKHYFTLIVYLSCKVSEIMILFLRHLSCVRPYTLFYYQPHVISDLPVNLAHENLSPGF